MPDHDDLRRDCGHAPRLRKSPATCELVLAELAAARGRHRDFDAAFERFAAALGAQLLSEAHARRLAQAFATLMQASLLLGAASAGAPDARAVAEAYCATRLGKDAGWGAVFGASDAAMDIEALLRRAWQEEAPQPAP